MGARQHYVARGYLRNFADPSAESREMLWVYKKDIRWRPRQMSTKAVAYAENYYAQQREDGSVDSERLEQAFHEVLEGRPIELTRRLDSVPGKFVELNPDEHSDLALLLGFSMARVPSTRDGFDELHRRIGELTLHQGAEHDPVLREAVDAGVEVVRNPHGSIHPMVKMGKAVADAAVMKHWQFHVAPSNVPLATTDNPVCFSGYRDPDGRLPVGPASPLAQFLFPLRPNLALVCMPGPPSRRVPVFKLSRGRAMMLNRNIVKGARRYVFLNRLDAGIDKLVKKSIGQEQRLRAD